MCVGSGVEGRGLGCRVARARGPLVPGKGLINKGLRTD